MVIVFAVAVAFADRRTDQLPGPPSIEEIVVEAGMPVPVIDILG